MHHPGIWGRGIAPLQHPSYQRPQQSRPLIEILRETPSFRAGRKGGGPCGATAEPSGGVEAPAFRPGRTSTEDRPQGFPNGAVQGLPAPLGHKHHVILAIPPGMRQVLIDVRHRVLLRCALIKPPEENSTPGSLKALPVSLVKPVAYPLLISYVERVAELILNKFNWLYETKIEL